MPETNRKIIRKDFSLTPFVFGLKRKTRIGTWNIKTMLESSKLAQVVKEFQLYNLEILGLCEVRWPDVGERKVKEKTLLFSGRPENQKRENGVGLLLSKNATKGLLDWKPISDRIILARFKTKVRNVTIIQCYAPTETSKSDDKDAFYDQLQNTFDSVNKGDIKIVLGDINAKVGSNNAHREHIMGKHGLGRMNENGELFTDFCQNNNLVIGGTVFPHKQIHKVTWVSPDGITRNQIDHITISTRWRRSLMDVRSFRGADAASDHYLLVGYIRLKINSNRSTASSAKRVKFNLEKLKNPNTLRAFQDSIQKDLLSRPNLDNAETSWTQISNVLLKSSEEVLGTKHKSQKNWLSRETWKLIQSRKEAKAKLNNAKTRVEHKKHSAEYSLLNNQVKRGARSDKRKWINQLADQAESAAHSHNMRKLYNITKQLSSKSFTSTSPLKATDGTLLTSTDSQLQRWEEHFSELLQTTETPIALPDVTPSRPLRIDTSAPTIKEIEAGILNLKNHKATGPDNIPAEILKTDPPYMAKLLHPILRNVWNKESIPNDWKEGIIVKLRKKGSPTECNNWRGITLLNTVNKILAQVIASRLSEKIEPRLRPEQAGFRPNRSCVDHIN